MKILDNKKDYYDYVAGEYGIDDLIVFDRRKALIIKTDVKPEKYKDYLFSTIKGDKDDYPKLEKTYYFGNRKKEKRGTFYNYALKTGRHLYHFEIERYLIDDMNVSIKTQLIKEEDNDILYPDLILAILPYKTNRYFHYFFTDAKNHPLTQSDVYEDQIIDLPILKDTEIPGYVPAKDVFLNIYSYLSSKKEKKIEDNRHDILKLESAGFDKIVSFRNIK
jgi:hypothetical protein